MGRARLRERSASRVAYVFAAAALFLDSTQAFATTDATCLSSYAQSGAVPGTGMSCQITAASNSPAGMGSYYCLNRLDLIENYCNSPPAVQPDKSCAVADPVYPASGSTTLTEADFVSGGDTPITFKRTYRSAPFLRLNSAIGAMWIHNWQRQLNLENVGGSSPEVTAYREDGNQVTFVKVNGAWTEVGGATLTLTDNGSTWALTDRITDSRETYSTQGVLSSVTSHEGRVTTLTYSDASTPQSVAPKGGLLIAVTDRSPENFYGFNLTLGFTYDVKSRIASMTDPTGAVTRYGYDTQNNLTSVTWPDGYVRRYVYSDNRFPGNLTGVIDETGSRIATWTYDAKGRATAVTHPNTTQNAQFSYGSNSTTVTDSRGNTALSYSLIAGAQRPTESVAPTGRSTSIKWDVSGNLLSSLTLDGYGNELSYDTVGRPIRQVTHDVAGTTVTSVRYADETGLRPWQIAGPGMMRTLVYDGKGNVTGVAEQTTDDPTGANGFDAKSGDQLRTYGLQYDAFNRVSYMLVVTNGVKESEWLQRYDGAGNRQLLSDRVSNQAFGVAIRDAAYRPVQIIGPGIRAYQSYDVRGRLKQFAYVEQANVLNGYVSRTMTVDYTYTPDGRVASRSATVQPDGKTATVLSSDETDQWLWNFEDGISPAGPAQGQLGARMSLRGPQEPGLEPVCVECFIPGIQKAGSAAWWAYVTFQKAREACQPVIADTSTVNWGANTNQISHTFRHLDEKGISRDAAMSAVRQDLAENGSSLSVGDGKSFYVNVGNWRIEYSAHRLSSIEIRVGSLRPTPR